MMVDLESAVALSGLLDRTDLILKMDVEGSGYTSITDPQTLICFEQIALEIHWLSQLTDRAFRASFTAMLRSILANFTIFHVHANKCAGLHFVGGAMTEVGEMGGLPIADVLDVSFVRNDLVSISANTSIYPTTMDFPNRLDRPDHLLEFFPFQTAILCD